MTRYFYSFLLSLILLVSLVLLHYFSFDRDGVVESQKALVTLTHLDTLSISSQWYEPEIPIFEDSINPVYPELLSLNRFNFIYGGVDGK